MKDGLGDILYLLAMMAFFVISSIIKSKKVKKNIPSPSTPVPENPFGHDEEDYSEGGYYINENEKEILSEEPKEKVTTVKEFLKRQERTDAMKVAKIILSENREEDVSSYWDEEEFDMKKAIIFSEILKRPEL